MNNHQYELIGESVWNTYEDMAYIMVEKSITAMHRAGEFKDDDIPITPRAKYKQRRSLERAEETLKRADRKQIYKNPGRSIRGNPPPSTRAMAALKRHPKKAKRLRVPPPLAANDTTHKMAAVVSIGAKEEKRLTPKQKEELHSGAPESWKHGPDEPPHSSTRGDRKK